MKFLSLLIFTIFYLVQGCIVFAGEEIDDEVWVYNCGGMIDTERVSNRPLELSAFYVKFEDFLWRSTLSQKDSSVSVCPVALMCYDVPDFSRVYEGFVAPITTSEIDILIVATLYTHPETVGIHRLKNTKGRMVESRLNCSRVK